VLLQQELVQQLTCRTLMLQGSLCWHRCGSRCPGALLLLLPKLLLCWYRPSPWHALLLLLLLGQQALLLLLQNVLRHEHVLAVWAAAYCCCC
jgi:hypothetical protein